jgi:hypothetical protein
MASRAGRSTRAWLPALDALLVIDVIPASARSSEPDGSVELVNRTWLDYTGFLLKSLMAGDGRPRFMWKVSSSYQTPGERDLKEGRECEVRLPGSADVFHWLLVRRAPLRDETGALVRWFGTGIYIEDSRQRELLRVAEKLALEMIAEGASLSEVLKQLCAAIDEHALAISLVMLTDRGGDQVLPFRGPSPPAGSDCRFYTLAGRPQHGLFAARQRLPESG